MTVHSVWLLRGLLVIAFSVIIACATNSPIPEPTAPVIPTGAPSSVVTLTETIRPTPAVTIPPTPEVTVATEEPTAIGAPTPRLPTSTPESQPTPAAPEASAPIPFLIRLRNNLDDPLGYCIDVRGFGAGIRLDADLQAHSCKSNSPDDQSFAMMDDRAVGTIVLVDYDVCLAAADPKPGASILLRPCDDRSVSQGVQLLADGRLRLQVEADVSQLELCVGVADGAGEPAGGRNHLRRDLMLLECDGTDPILIAWEVAPTR